MPWCPKCKMEYREGFTKCADCGEYLVDKLPEEEPEPASEPVTFYRPIPENTYGEVDPEALVAAAKEYARRNAPAKPYMDSASQAEENKSSGWILIIGGIVGLVILLLGLLGVIQIRLGSPYLFYGVLSAICILFIVMGIISMKNARIFAREAKSEHSLEESLLEWAGENLTAEKVDSYLPPDERRPGEHLYFYRSEIIVQLLSKQFVNLDPDFVEHLIDDKIYDSLYGEEGK